jgi:ABC-type glutathione transport system ATPase component
MATEGSPLLRAAGYSLRRADGLPVLQDLSFELGRGEILGVVGESGSGKSQLLLSLLGLAMRGARVAGSCCFDGIELVGAEEPDFRALRGKRIAMLFQDPLLSWNPYLTIGTQLTEVLHAHCGLRAAAAAARAAEALAAVGLAQPQRTLLQYPHELSGGMRQRAMLAMAVLAEPDLLLADEPTTALDATTQIAVLDLLASLRRERGMSILLVTHDLGVVARIADRVMVMRSGRIVEQGRTAGLLQNPASEYARELLAAARQLEQRELPS